MGLLFSRLSFFSLAQEREKTLESENQKKKREEGEMQLRSKKTIGEGHALLPPPAAAAKKLSRMTRKRHVEDEAPAVQRSRKRQRAFSYCTSPRSAILARHSEFNW